MAKDDYDYIVFKILTYLYGVLKRKYLFKIEAFNALISKEVSEEYLSDILRMMQAEVLIEGLAFTKAWGNYYIILNNESEMRITAEGVRYLNDNGKMKKTKDIILQGAGLAATLVQTVFGN